MQLGAGSIPSFFLLHSICFSLGPDPSQDPIPYQFLLPGDLLSPFSQVLNQYKKRLQALTQESDRLSSEFKSRSDLREKIEAEVMSLLLAAFSY